MRKSKLKKKRKDPITLAIENGHNYAVLENGVDFFGKDRVGTDKPLPSYIVVYIT